MANPSDARPAPGVTGVLSDLAEAVGLVAIISGRPVEYLAEHLKGLSPQVQLHGLYGLERSSEVGDGTRSSPGAERWRQAIDDAARRAQDEIPGVHVEHKGLTVTLHYRSRPEQGPAIESSGQAIAAELGLVAHPGKMSIELRPPLDVDKGSVVAQLTTQLSVVVFAGDDIGDLPAYAAVGARGREGLTTLSVAAGGPETPQAVLDAADLIVDGPAGVVDLLGQIVSRLRR